MVPVPKMSPSGWNCAQVRAAREEDRAVLRAHGRDKHSERFLVLQAAHCAQDNAWHPAGAGSKCILRTSEQVTK